METRPPKDMTIAEIETELEQQANTCEASETEMRALYLALDEATFRLRATRSRIDLLRAEISRRKSV
jgi:hypothetical protein